MTHPYDVKIWKIETRKWKSKSSHRVTWFVSSERFNEKFETFALADSFRSELVKAARSGEAFDTGTGLPMSKSRVEATASWFSFARDYVDMKWPRAAAKTRAGIADTLATVTPMMFTSDRGRPRADILRKAMTGWAFNKKRREDAKPRDIAQALNWLEANTALVLVLDDVANLRKALDALSLKMDGKQAAAKTVTRKRAVLYNVLDYAVERKLLTANRLAEVKWQAPKTVRAIDKRVVINVRQAEQLLDAVAAQKVDGQPRRSAGPLLKAHVLRRAAAGGSGDALQEGPGAA